MRLMGSGVLYIRMGAESVEIGCVRGVFTKKSNDFKYLHVVELDRVHYNFMLSCAPMSSGRSRTSLDLPPRRRMPRRLQEKLQQVLLSSLNNLPAHSHRSYRYGLTVFARWLAEQDAILLEQEPQRRSPEWSAWQDRSIEVAGRYFLSLKQHEAGLLGEAYVQDLLFIEPKVSRATARQRLAAIYWAARQAKRLGQIDWNLEIPLPQEDKEGKRQIKPGRDMSGPTIPEAKRLLAAAREDPDPRAYAIVSLLRYEGYREHEVRQIDFENIDLEYRWVKLIRKKRSKSQRYPLSEQSVVAIKQWLRVRGRAKGPLFYGGKFGTGKGTRIGTTIIWTIVRRIGKAAKYKKELSPHRIRHRACTDIVRVALKRGLPEEDLLFLTGHSSRAALYPYYEAT